MTRYIGLLAFLSLLSLPHPACATTQIQDTIWYEGKEYAIGECPLLTLLLSGRCEWPELDGMSTANRKGFVAVWEIRDARLYLTSFEAKRNKKPLPIGALYPGRTLPVLADWYTGKIHIATGDWIGFTFLDAKYTRVRVLDIEEGRVVGSTERRNAKLNDRVRCDLTDLEAVLASVPRPVVGVDWSGSGSGLLVTQRETVLRFDTKSNEVTTVYALEEGEVYGLVEARFAGEGFAVRTKRRALMLLDAKGKQVWTTGDVAGFAISSTREQLAVIDFDRWITIYQLGRGVPQSHVRWRLRKPPGMSLRRKSYRLVPMFDFCAEDQKLVGCISWMGESQCFVAGVEQRKELAWYPGGAFAATQLNYPYLATITPPYDIIVRDLRKGSVVARHAANKHPPLRSCWVSPRAERLLVMSDKMQLIDAKEAKVVNEWEWDSGFSSTLPFSYSNKSDSIAMGTVDGKVLLFDCAGFRFSQALSCEPETRSEGADAQACPKSLENGG